MTPEFLRSDALEPCPHGFFTRRGGASGGHYAELNCALRSSDDRAVVEANRRAAVEAIGLDAGSLATGIQSHSATAIKANGGTVAAMPSADALATSTPGIAVGVLTADCQPVLLSDPSAGVVAAAHAGWRGALDGIIESTVLRMVALGAERQRIRAVVGPSISMPNYEVGEEFRAEFLAKDKSFGGFFGQDSGGRLRFNLPAFGLEMLRRSGVESAAWTGHCTYADEARFFSYRRSRHRGEKAHGLQISMIAVR